MLDRRHLPAYALLITTAAWLVTGVIGSLPFILLLETPIFDAIFESVSGSAPPSAMAFVDLLTAQTSRLPVDASIAETPETKAPPVPAPPADAPEGQDEVKTYGIPGPDDVDGGE